MQTVVGDVQVEMVDRSGFVVERDVGHGENTGGRIDLEVARIVRGKQRIGEETVRRVCSVEISGVKLHETNVGRIVFVDRDGIGKRIEHGRAIVDVRENDDDGLLIGQRRVIAVIGCFEDQSVLLLLLAIETAVHHETVQIVVLLV